jgi:hypothetical protein
LKVECLNWKKWEWKMEKLEWKIWMKFFKEKIRMKKNWAKKRYQNVKTNEKKGKTENIDKKCGEMKIVDQNKRWPQLLRSTMFQAPSIHN